MNMLASQEDMTENTPRVSFSDNDTGDRFRPRGLDTISDLLWPSGPRQAVTCLHRVGMRGGEIPSPVVPLDSYRRRTEHWFQHGL